MSKLMIEYDAAARPPRDLVRAMLRGFAERCPSCGKGRLFGRYLKVRDSCPAAARRCITTAPTMPRPTSRS